MSKSNYLENALLLNVFNATALPFAADTNWHVALHTADPGEAGTQSTSEVSYTGYARVTVARTSGGWTVTGGSVSNTATVQFPVCSAPASVIATHFSIGRLASGAGDVLYKGALDSPLTIGQNVRPEFAPNALTVQED